MFINLNNQKNVQPINKTIKRYLYGCLLILFMTTLVQVLVTILKNVDLDEQLNNVLQQIAAMFDLGCMFIPIILTMFNFKLNKTLIYRGYKL